MERDNNLGVLNVYIPLYIPSFTLLGGKRSVILHFLKYPSFNAAVDLLKAVKEGRKYLDSVRMVLNPYTFLGRSLQSLAGIQTHKVIVNVYTNAKSIEISEFIENYPRSRNFEIVCHSVDLLKLEHPYFLTWAHRHQMQSDIAKGGRNDLFLYLEHDVDFRSENLDYFLEYRRKLVNRIIPGFMLVEWNSVGKYWSNFQIEPHDFDSDLNMSLDGIRFIPLRQPYCPVLLLDQALAKEFLKSEFFKLEDFREMQSKYGLLVRESAAIGLTYFGRESEYGVRSYVGFEEDNKFPTVGAVVRHMPNIYADSNSVSQCTYPLRDMWID